jgi:hypothetical protein
MGEIDKYSSGTGIMDCMNATEIEVAVWLFRPGKNLEKTLNRRNIAARRA